MKIQTKAIISGISTDGDPILLDEEKYIDLEFSAIDTGGGFKDPILDFSFEIDDPNLLESVKTKGELTVRLADPQKREKEAAFSYHLDPDASGKRINGRLKEEQLGQALIGFVLHLLR